MSNLTKAQKITIGIFGAFLLFLIYCLSIAVLILMVSDFSGVKGVAKISLATSTIKEHFSLGLPIQAIEQGFLTKYLIAFFGTGIAVSAIGYLIGIALKKNHERRNIFGKASWSNEQTIRKNRLREKKGIIVGKDKNGLLIFGGQEFASVGAPTRSGKGVGVVIPNLLTWEDSCVVLDVKQECFDITSRYRQDKLGQKVFLFDPFSFNTHRYNPLEYLDFSKPDIELQIQALAESLYPAGKGGKDFFILQAQSVFVAITYLVGILKENSILGSSFTLTTLAGALQGVKVLDYDEESGDFFPKVYPLQETVETVNCMGLLSETIYAKFQSFFEQAEAKDQFAGVKSSFETPLKVFQDPLFEMATSTNDFDFRNLRKKK